MSTPHEDGEKFMLLSANMAEALKDMRSATDGLELATRELRRAKSRFEKARQALIEAFPEVLEQQAPVITNIPQAPPVEPQPVSAPQPDPVMSPAGPLVFRELGDDFVPEM